MTPREQLDHCLARLVDAVLAGNDSAARLAIAGAVGVSQRTVVNDLATGPNGPVAKPTTVRSLDGTQSRITAALPRARNRAAQ